MPGFLLMGYCRLEGVIARTRPGAGKNGNCPGFSGRLREHRTNLLEEQAVTAQDIAARLGIERMPTVYEAEVLEALNDALWEAS